MRSERRQPVPAAALALAVVAAVVLTGCAAGGNGLSRTLSDQAAAAVAAKLDSVGEGERTAEQIVSEEVFAADVRSGSVPVVTSSITPVAWSGTTVDEAGGARIVIRVTTEVQRADAVSIGGTSYSAGSDEGCYEIRVTSWSHDESTPRRVDCPEGADPARPSARYVPPSLPADDVIVEAVRGASDAAAARLKVLGSADEGVVVEAIDFDGGIVAAVGVPSERECTLAVRDAAGEVRLSGVGNPEWLLPGEIGCSIDLITNPPR